MAVTWNPPKPEGKLVADRELYLDSTTNRLVEKGDAASASQFAAEGHVIDQAEADRLGLSEKGGKIVQDHPAKIADLRKNYDALVSEQKAFADLVAEYKKENAVNDIPNTMELARVELENKVEQARLNVAQAIKAEQGKNPILGESQATALKPEKSAVTKKAVKKGKGK